MRAMPTTKPFDLRTARVISGELRGKQTRQVAEWIMKHQAELMANWELAVVGRPTFRIPGLDDE